MTAAADGPRLSVVVTTYEHAAYLGEALASVRRGQPPVHEVVVVDDGSTDRPDLVVASHPGVRLLRQDNRGLSAARNAGLRASTGEYVLFLDADDVLVPGGLQASLEAARAHPEAAIVYGAHVRTGPDGRTVTQTVYVPVDDDDAHGQFLRGNPVGMHASALLRRETVVDAGGFDETLPAAEDYDLYLRLVATHPVHSHSTVVAAYRIHGENMSADSALMLRSVLEVLARQRRRVRGDRARTEALRTGVGVWLSYYLRQSAGSVTRDASRWRRVLLLAAAQFPGAFLHWVLRRGLRAVRPRAITAARRAAVGVPLPVRAGIARARGHVPPVGAVHLGDLDRTSPIARDFGYARGGPVDRHYIEGFLHRSQDDIRGRVLEIGDDAYTRAFGASRVERRDVLHVHAGNPLATFVGDLAGDNELPSAAFDCVILTQTLQLVFDPAAAMRTVHRILKPGGVLLATVPGISNIDRDEWGPSWYWSFTTHSMRRLAAEAFPHGVVDVAGFGNVKAAITFLHGMSVLEVDKTDLDVVDPSYPVVITLRAVKAKGSLDRQSPSDRPVKPL